MSCLNPLHIKRFDYRTNDFVNVCVRCRHCEDCKQAMRSSAFVRMKYELEHCQKLNGMIFFFTLTFADEFVPFKFHRMCFDKKIVQKWLQSFRQEFRRKYGFTLKYLIVSEIGHVGTHRPHHHGLLYFYPETKYQLKQWKEGGKFHSRIPLFSATYASIISKLWTFGRADISEFDPSRGGIAYISKYISKDVEEDSLFKDIITRIQMKRGKSNCVLPYNHRDKWHVLHGKIKKRVQLNHQDYLLNTFPSLFSFMNRYCPFTMISNGLGESAPISRKDCVEDKCLSVDGFNYNIPRYYKDRYARRDVIQNLPTHQYVSCFTDIKDYPFMIERRLTQTVVKDHLASVSSFAEGCYTPHVSLFPFSCPDGIVSIYNRVSVPSPYYINECPPPDKVLEKCKVYDNLFDFHYENVPIYHYKFQNGKYRRLKYIPRVSEYSSLTDERNRFQNLNLLSIIEDRYYNLPPILRDSCEYDVPGLLLDKHNFIDDFSQIPTSLCISVLASLDELSLVASEWRSKHRIMKREQDRKDKMQRNSPYAKRPLSWSEYKKKSLYLQSFIKKQIV